MQRTQAQGVVIEKLFGIKKTSRQILNIDAEHRLTGL